MSSFLKPMLASPMPEGFRPAPGQWAVEQKYDGHRLLVQITRLREGTPVIQAWSRNGLTRDLPAHLLEAMASLPNGLYDGELIVPGDRSYGVTDLAKSQNLVYVVFDVLTVLTNDVTGSSYDLRRKYLVAIFNHKAMKGNPNVFLAPSWNVDTLDQIRTACQLVWDQDGEGLIIKRRLAPYVPGKRSKDFIKVKALRSAVLTVVGFQAGKGTIVDRGPYATVVLRDENGVETAVKTLDDAELARFERGGHQTAIGRKLRIEYHEKTPDGKYRHPRWDRWEDE
jgi:bifunctional non-homologous end joining protein LigD